VVNKTVPWLRRLVATLSPRRLGFALGTVHVGFVDKLALGQVFLRVLLFPPVSIIPPRLSIQSHNTRGMNNRPVSGRSSETLSHPIDMNNSDKW
jgi:hypothetical protein